MHLIAISAILSSPKVKALIDSIAKDAASVGKKALIGHLQPTAREKAALEAIKLFVEQWDEELEATSIFDASIDPLRDQLKSLVEVTAAEIALWMDPETADVNLTLIANTWAELKLDPLPRDFKWTRVAENYARAIRKYIKNDPALRDAYAIALQERQTKAIERLAPTDPGFDLTAYRRFIIEKKSNALQLAVLHSSTYEFAGKVVLWSVFVPQNARESAPIHDLPPELQRRLREQGHLTSPADIEELAEQRSRFQSSPVRPLFDILGLNRHVVIVGDPGSGKTSMLKYRSLSWAKEGVGPLPMLVDLKEYALEREGILQYCQSAQEIFRLNAEALRKQLQSGQAAFYLDGLDEIFDPVARQAVIEEIVVLSANYPQASIVVTSRKVGYEPERLRNAGFFHATLEEFDLQQMLSFLRQWYRLAEADDIERALMQQRLEMALQESTAIRELAGNPLLLTMMAILNRNQELPRYRVDLYREASRVLLNDWDARRALPVGEFDREDKEALLRELAGEMQQAEGGLAGNLIGRSHLKTKIREFLKVLHVEDSHGKANQLVAQLAERNFILAYAGADSFSFVHRTFLEYYCASWFVDRFQKKQDLTLEQLKMEVFGRHWRDEKWHEVLCLIAGMLGEKKAEDLILFLMDEDGTDERLANLMLAAGCLIEVRNRGAIQSTAERLWRRLEDEAIRFEPSYFYEPWEELDECGTVRQAAVHWMAQAWKGETAWTWLRVAGIGNPDWIIRQAAARELARGWKDHPQTFALLRGLAGHDTGGFVRQAAVQELARGWKDAFDTLPWLKHHAEKDENSYVRLSALAELARGWKNDSDTLRLAKDRARNDKHYAVRQVAVQELARGWKEDPDTLSLVMDRAHTDESYSVRQSAVQELARGWKEQKETLLLLKDRAASDEYYRVRRTALQELARGWKHIPKMLDWLKDRAQDGSDNALHETAVQELARGWKSDPEIAPWLKQMARNGKDEYLREAAMRELARGWRDDPESLPLLKSLARTDHAFVRQGAVKELARGWKDDPAVLPSLKECARNDEDPYVRATALLELARGWKDDPEIRPLLEQCSREGEHDAIRQASVQELARGWKNSQETLSLLKDRLRNDAGANVRQAALEELARGWKDDPEVLLLLKDHARGDEGGWVRSAAIREIAQRWKNDSETLLLLGERVRYDPSPVVRQSALQELEWGWKDDPGTLSIFVDRAHNDEDKDVRETALSAMARIGKANPEVADLLRN